MSILTERDHLVDELRRSDKLLLTTHENPDGDALGSLLGMHLVLEQLGKDSVMFLAANQFPLPYEYQRMQLGDESAREDALAGLRHSKGFLQSVVGKELRMKRTPTLDFVYDATSEKAERLTRLIDEIAPDDPPASDDPPAEEPS